MGGVVIMIKSIHADMRRVKWRGDNDIMHISCTFAALSPELHDCGFAMLQTTIWAISTIADVLHITIVFAASSSFPAVSGSTAV
jgi:hypothetical protein